MYFRNQNIFDLSQVFTTLNIYTMFAISLNELRNRVTLAVPKVWGILINSSHMPLANLKYPQYPKDYHVNYKAGPFYNVYRQTLEPND